jgi:tRNA-dihydrouridine synthase
VKIPVIGNGDVTDGASAQKMLQTTGCDGIMVGRAARGNPWIFRQINAYLTDGTILQKPEIEEVKATILRHAALQLETKGEYTGIREMRKHVSWYTAGYPNSARLRQNVNLVESFEELRELVLSM